MSHCFADLCEKFSFRNVYIYKLTKRNSVNLERKGKGNHMELLAYIVQSIGSNFCTRKKVVNFPNSPSHNRSYRRI